MEMRVAASVEDGCQQKWVNDVVFQVLAEKTKKNKFFVNVGMKGLPVDSSAGTRRELQEALASEKQTSADLRDLVNIQCQQLDDMVKKVQTIEEERWGVPGQATWNWYSTSAFDVHDSIESGNKVRLCGVVDSFESWEFVICSYGGGLTFCLFGCLAVHLDLSKH